MRGFNGKIDIFIGNPIQICWKYIKIGNLPILDSGNIPNIGNLQILISGSPGNIGNLPILISRKPGDIGNPPILTSGEPGNSGPPDILAPGNLGTWLEGKYSLGAEHFITIPIMIPLH